METLKIYSIISTIAVVALSVSLYNTTKNYNKTQNEFDKKKKELKETEEVLQQCSYRYYKAITK